jgi:tetratricopeptide (TPR) repeat protein
VAELALGDLAVRASFEISYQALPAGMAGGSGMAQAADPADPAKLFRLLGLAGPVTIGVGAVAALAGWPPGGPGDDPPAGLVAALETLTDAHLLETPAPGRYRLHDLLRSYAAGLARHTDSEQERITALGRMLRWYCEHAARAARALAPRQPASELFQITPSPELPDPAQAIDWYETELASLRGAVRQAAGLGLHDIAAQTAATMKDFFTRTSHLDDWVAITETGVASARQLDDDAVLSLLLNSLGQVRTRQHRYPLARACLAEALEIRRRTGDRAVEAAVLNSLGGLAFIQGRFSEALDCVRSALAIYTEISEPRQVGACLVNIGNTLLHLHRYDEALDHMARALVIQQEIGDKHGEGITETTIADTYLALDRYTEAVEHYQRSWAALQDTSRDSPHHAGALYGMGAALAGLGRAEEARQAWQAAIPILDRLGDPRAAELRGRLTGSSGTGETAFALRC